MGSVTDAALLAGGNGSRMQNGGTIRPEGKLDADLEGKSICRRSMERLRWAFPEAFLVVRRGFAPRSAVGMRIEYDVESGSGPAAGIAAALERAGDWCFIAAADMPFLDAGLIWALKAEVEALPGWALCAVPEWRKGREPLHAFYRKGALGAVESFLASRKRSMNELTDSLGACLLDAEDAALRCGCDLEASFFNVNTSFDLDRAREIVREREEGRG